MASAEVLAAAAAATTPGRASGAPAGRRRRRRPAADLVAVEEGLASPRVAAAIAVVVVVAFVLHLHHTAGPLRVDGRAIGGVGVEDAVAVLLAVDRHGQRARGVAAGEGGGGRGSGRRFYYCGFTALVGVFTASYDGGRGIFTVSCS